MKAFLLSILIAPFINALFHGSIPRRQHQVERSFRITPNYPFHPNESQLSTAFKLKSASQILIDSVEADPIGFAELLGVLTPPPSDRSDIIDESLIANAVRSNLDRILNGPFLIWLQDKIKLNEDLGNQTAYNTLRIVEKSIAESITEKLRPATELIVALLGTECSGARGQLLREILILPGESKHPLHIPPGDPKRQFGEATVDPYDFKRAWDILALSQGGDANDGQLMMETVLKECACVLNGEVDVKSDKEIATCSSKV